MVRETGDILDDGMKTVCVNTKINDGSLIAELMQLFTQTEIKNSKFPVFTKRMDYIKNSERGQRQMCEIMEQYVKEYAEEYAKETKKEMIQGLLLQDVSINIIAQSANVDTRYILKIQNDMIESGQLQMGKKTNI